MICLYLWVKSHIVLDEILQGRALFKFYHLSAVKCHIPIVTNRSPECQSPITLFYSQIDRKPVSLVPKLGGAPPRGAQ